MLLIGLTIRHDGLISLVLYTVIFEKLVNMIFEKLVGTHLLFERNKSNTPTKRGFGLE